MTDTVDTGILQRDVEAIDELDDDTFRGLVEKRIEDTPSNRATWKILYHPTLIERVEGCLEELAEELSDEIMARGFSPGHHKAKQLRLVNHRLHQLHAVSKAVAERRMGNVSGKEREKQETRALVRNLALAIDAHRQECIRQDLSPEPHDVMLWGVLDALTLPAGGDKQGPTLAEVITAGHWRHQEAGV